MTTPKPIPEGMHSLIPHLVCRNASAAIAFYIKAFGAVEHGRLVGPDGKIVHAMIHIGDAPLFLFDEMPDCGAQSPLALKGSPVTLHRYVVDVDAAVARAVDAGAKLTMPPADMFWGDRYARVEDPSGHQWSLATHIRDVKPEDMQAAMSAECKP
jgi:uncharacterized glyoxalase superfamily protein PhnB